MSALFHHRIPQLIQVYIADFTMCVSVSLARRLTIRGHLRPYIIERMRRGHCICPKPQGMTGLDNPVWRLKVCGLHKLHWAEV